MVYQGTALSCRWGLFDPVLSPERYPINCPGAPLDNDHTDLPAIEIVHERDRERLDALYTEPGRRLGELRWEFLQQFFDRFTRSILS